MLHTNMFLRLGTYFNLLIRIWGELWNTLITGVSLAFIRVLYGRMIYISLPSREILLECYRLPEGNCELSETVITVIKANEKWKQNKLLMESCNCIY